MVAEYLGARVTPSPPTVATLLGIEKLIPSVCNLSSLIILLFTLHIYLHSLHLLHTLRTSVLFYPIIVNITLPTFHSNLGRSIWLLSPQHVCIRVARTLEWGDVIEVYSCGNRKLFTLDQAHVMTRATSTKFVPNACIWYHLVILVIKPKPIFKWTMSNWASHAHYGPLRWTFVLFKGFTTCLRRLKSFLTYVGFIIPCW